MTATDNSELRTVLLFRTLAQVQQDWLLDATYRVTKDERYARAQTVKLRVEIRRNAHDFQSSAHVSMWHADGWHQIASLPATPDEMTVLVARGDGVPLISYANSALSDEALKRFAADEHRLLDMARAVVF
jgi:hypothetical protein